MMGYSGSESYKSVDSLINGPSRTVMISSPYIDVFYARALIRAARKKKIFLLTTRSAVNRQALSVLSRKGYGIMPKVFIYLLTLLTISILLHLYYASVVVSLLLVPVLVRLYIIYRHRREGASPNLKVKIARGRFVHEKLYISDAFAIVGSVNLTYNGMHKNVEHIERIDDPARVSELRSHFERMWKDGKKSKILPSF